MLNFSKKSEVKNAIIAERKLLDSYKQYEAGMKDTISVYLKELANVSFDNDALKTILLNNFENAIVQLDNNILDLDSLSNALDILDSQKEVSVEDSDAYNKIASKAITDMELAQNFLQNTISSFENVTISGKRKSISILEECKTAILGAFPFSISKKDEKHSKSTKKGNSFAAIQKNFDYSSSDLLCFFPKTKDDNLVISTVQDDYRISFKGTTATIYIEDENFNISLNTPGVQISNSNTNNILFVSHIDSKFTIVTNDQMEIPPFIQICKIAKNEDFLEVEVSKDSLDLYIEDNIINFEDTNSQSTINIDDLEVNEVPSKVEKAPAPKPAPAPVQQDNSEEEITDNDTLIISDTNKTVILPYKVADLEQKLQKNKNYKTLKDVIDKEYTFPMDTFKNPVKSRFREAFQLIKKKEHGSLKEAISLGFELMFQSDLNPAVIAACKDLDELDIYLDCLDDNELDKFSCFKILYNVPPTKN